MHCWIRRLVSVDCSNFPVDKLSGVGATVKSRKNGNSGQNDCRYDDINSIKENTDEVHDQLVRTFARIAYGVRECPEADTGGFHSMEGARQFQNRVVRCASGRVGWAHVGGLRRSVGHSQVLLDLTCI